MSGLLKPRSFVIAGTLALAAGLAAPLGAVTAASAAPPPDTVKRGEYLVKPAGQCADCHGANLHGGPAPPGPPGAPFAKTAPSLAGLTMFKRDADAITFLSTTKLPNGHQARPPMPRYNFSHDDAAAIVAYLRTVK